MQRSSSGSGRNTDICQRPCINQALVRCFIHMMSSHALIIMPALQQEKLKLPKDSQLARGKVEANTGISGFVCPFFRRATLTCVQSLCDWFSLALSGTPLHREVYFQWFLIVCILEFDCCLPCAICCYETALKQENRSLKQEKNFFFFFSKKGSE